MINIKSSISLNEHIFQYDWNTQYTVPKETSRIILSPNLFKQKSIGSSSSYFFTAETISLIADPFGHENTVVPHSLIIIATNIPAKEPITNNINGSVIIDAAPKGEKGEESATA